MKRIMLRLMAPALVLFVAMGATATSAHATATQCDWAPGGVQTCLHVVGSGTYVDGIGLGVGLNPGESTYGHHEVWGDRGARLYFNTRNGRWTNPHRWQGTTLWDPGHRINGSFPNGSRICASFWEGSGHPYTRRGIACVNIHR